jgi:hypothetical protein
MNGEIKKKLKYFLENGQIKEALTFIDLVETTSPPRTQEQHNALFLWFSMIEREAENQGVTWDMVIKYTHQLRITKETLHGMCKSLQQALWKTTSTKELKKIGHIDIIIDHFTDLFSKVGLELPPFPEDKDKPSNFANIEMASRIDYPLDDIDPKNDKF